MNITIFASNPTKVKTIELKYSLRSMLMYENVTNQTFNPTTISQLVTYLYCIVICSDPTLDSASYKRDDLIQDIDSNPSILVDFGDWFRNVALLNDQVKKN